jgi:pimeloyl-ACP methyl ester carboxylesterase
MVEAPIRVAVSGGMLVGRRGGDGRPALLLHGGPGTSDYTDGCAAELHGLLHVARYTQRGVPPSTAGPPYTIESHVADAVAVLDALGFEKAWVLGHSWGAHLALHLLVTHPDRVAGAVCVSGLCALDVFAEFEANLRARLPCEAAARADAIDALEKRGEATEADLLESFSLVWPAYFARPDAAPPFPIERMGVRCSAETNESIAHHLHEGTLGALLPQVVVPVLFVHGVEDPLPARGSTETAALIPGARVELVERCGHFPWLERPGVLREAVAAFVGDGAPSRHEAPPSVGSPP